MGFVIPHLVLVLFICTAELEATEYYVQPTEPPGTSCPGQPCLTLSQYSNYMNQVQGFGSDVVFKFLPGTHNVTSPLTFTNVSNVSLIGTPSHSQPSESDLPVLITQSFSCPHCNERDQSGCDFCSVIDFKNVTGARIEGIKIVVTAQSSFQLFPFNGIISQHSNSTAIEYVHIIRVEMSNSTYPTIGISFNNARNTNISNTLVENFDVGIGVANTEYVLILNSVVSESIHVCGILVVTSSFVKIQDVNIRKSLQSGLCFHKSNEIVAIDNYIESTYLVFGIDITNSSNIIIDKAVINTNMSEAQKAISATQSNGINIEYSKHVSIDHTLVNSTGIGVSWYSSRNLTLRNSTIFYTSTNGYVTFSSGIMIVSSNDTAVVNSVVWDYCDGLPTDNQLFSLAIFVRATNNTAIIGVTISSSSYRSNTLHGNFIAPNGFINFHFYTIGIHIENAKNTTILHTIVENFNGGIIAAKMEDISVIESTFNNGLSAIYLLDSTFVTIQEADIRWSTVYAIYIMNCSKVVVTYTQMDNTYVWYGIYITNTNNITIDNTVINANISAVVNKSMSGSRGANTESNHLPISHNASDVFSVDHFQWGSSWGISIQQSNNVCINSTIVKSTLYGILLSFSGHVTLINSIVHYRSRGSGIMLSNANNVVMVNSVVWGYSYPYDLLNVTFAQNALNSAILLDNVSNTAIIGIRLSSAYIINSWLSQISKVNQTNNFSDKIVNGTMYMYGFYIYNAKNITILHAHVENFKQGISVNKAEDISIIDSTVNNSAYGITFYYCTSVKVQSIDIHRSIFNSLSILTCIEVVANDLYIEDTYIWDGIYIFDSRNTTIRNVVVACSNQNVSEAKKAISGSSILERFFTCIPYVGIGITNSINTSVDNAAIQRAFLSGIDVMDSSFTTITNISNITNILEGNGITVLDSTHTDISQISIADVFTGQCIFLNNATITTINSSHLMNCKNSGVVAVQGTNLFLISTFISGSFFGIAMNGIKSSFVDTAFISNTHTGVWIANNSIQSTLQRIVLDTNYGIFILFSKQIFISILIANNTNAVITSVHARDVTVHDSTINKALSSIDIIIENSYQISISNLTLSFSYTQIQISQSRCIIIQNIHQDRDSTATNVRLIIGNVTDMFLSNIAFRMSSDNVMSSGPRTGGQVDITRSANVLMSNVSFREYTDTFCYYNDTCFTEADSTVTIDTHALRSVVYLQSSTNMTFEDCSFINNNVTALKAFDSSIVFSSSINFTNNRAVRGAAIILSQRSYMTITDNAVVIFKENTARLTGGAIYLDGYRDKIEDSYEYTTIKHETHYPEIYRFGDENHTVKDYPIPTGRSFRNIVINFTMRWFYNEIKYNHCFLQVNASEATLLFVNNTAVWGGDVLYGGHLDWECISHNNTCVDSCLRFFKNATSITPEHSLSQISSDPLRVCLCSSQNTSWHAPDCTIVSKTFSAYPGQTISIKAVVVGQDFGTVRGSVYGQFMQTEQISNETTEKLEPGQAIQDALSHHCNQLNYTLLSNRVQEVTLVLATSFQKVYHYVSDEEVSQAVEEYNSKPYTAVVFSSTQFEVHTSEQNKTQFSDKLLHFPVFLNITLLKCPLGFVLNSVLAKCDCNHLLQQIPGTICDIDDSTIERSGPVWIGTVDINNTVVDVAVALYCPFDFCSSEAILMVINSSQTNGQCNYNHSGILCGGCQSGLSLAVGSSKCLQCSNTYLSLLIPFAVAGIVLVFFIKILNFTVSSGTINGLVFYANIVKANEAILFPHKESNVLTVFISWINLDLGIEACFVDGFTAYWKTWMQFIFPLYVWAIAGCIIISSKYSRHLAKMMGNNSVPVLATLFLLSYAKLLRSVITILQYSVLEYSSGQKLVWSADGNLDYLGPQHIPLFAAAVAVLLFLWLPYTLLLFSGQWLHKCNFKFVNRFMIKVKPLLDAYHGPLEDNHRYWFGALLLMRAVILLVSALVPSTSSNITMLIISTCSAMLLFSVNRNVYNNKTVSSSETLFFLNLILLTQARLFSISSGGNQTLAAHLLVGVAFLQFVLLVLLATYNRFRKTRVCVAVRTCVHREREADDEMELFHLADADREVDRDSVSTESSDCDSQHSLPTY